MELVRMFWSHYKQSDRHNCECSGEYSLTTAKSVEEEESYWSYSRTRPLLHQ